MSLRGTLTNEKLIKRFNNPFALVRHAIKMADKAVERGDGMHLYLASEILEDMAYHEAVELEADKKSEGSPS
jgi:hypothetical protein